MATKIRRSLFVGLGGTGMKALLHTKKMFVDTYGEVPPMVGFLGIDTDGGEYNKTLKSSYGEIRLEPSEQKQILVRQNPQPVYTRQQARFAWFPSENLRSLRDMKLGAGQIRSNGRFAITYNEYELKEKLQSVISNRILIADNAVNRKYELLSSDVEIHVVFSVCGGTGSGTFINMAYLLREVVPNAKIYAYAVLPGVFETMINLQAAKAKVPSNAYGALLDLDYLMHLKTDDTPVAIDYLTRTYATNDRPFDAVYLIDNQNVNNDVYNNTDDLAQMISLALITSTGELSKEQQSVFDNVIKVIQDGNMDIENKSAWVAGFGICEICYNGEQLSEILKLKTIQRIIELLQSPEGDANITANNWIDNNNIRENNGKDDVIDKICNTTPKIPFDAINTTSNPKPEIDAYLNNLARIKPEEIAKTIEVLKKETKTALKTLVIQKINEKGGVVNCKNIINEIDQQITLCVGEMRQELADFENKRPVIQSQVDTTSQELVDYMDKWIKTKTQQYIDAVLEAVNLLAVNLRETDRRKGAIQFYTWLKEELGNLLAEISNFEEVLNAIKSKCENKVAEIQYDITNNTNIFQIDLAKNEVNKVTFDDNLIVMNDFINQISLPNQLFDLFGLNSETIFNFIYNYAEKISDSSKFSGSSVDSILRTLSEEELNAVLKEAVVKSEPLIKYNNKGWISNYPPERYFFVGVEDKSSSILKENDRFARMFTDRVPQFASIGLKDKIIIYCQYANMPLFTVEPVPTYEHRYNEVMRNSNCHFGIDLKARMDRENFSIYPRDNSTDAVELWVKGLIFGLIKNEGDKYVFKCEAEGDIIDDYWVDLPQDRYEAFADFKNRQTVIEKEYEEYFDKYLRDKGQEEIDKIYADARQNYEAKYAQLGIDKTTLKSRGYELVLKLYRQELEYVKKQL